MKRRLSKVLSSLLLILALLFTSAWLSSYWHYIYVEKYTGRSYQFSSANGRVWLRASEFRAVGPQGTEWGSHTRNLLRYGNAPDGYGSFWNQVGFVLDGYHWHPPSLHDPSIRYTSWNLIIGVPYWSIVPPLLVLPVCRRIAARRLATRARLRLCVTCGYDLRASTERCPECGTAV